MVAFGVGFGDRVVTELLGEGLALPLLGRIVAGGRRRLGRPLAAAESWSVVAQPAAAARSSRAACSGSTIAMAMSVPSSKPASVVRRGAISMCQ